jgi:FHS family L-fucose permease-like MFS transporter
MLRSQRQGLLFPFIMVTTLFFLWGFCHSMLDVLNRHFQGALDLTLGQSGFIQSASYLAYFLMAMPAALIAKRFGYKGGILTGLGLVAIGAILFIPCALVFKSFLPFLIALFILFSGLTFLETTANPYVTVLGPRETAASRLVLSQSFNGVGWTVGPLVGGLLILSSGATTEGHTAHGGDLSSLVMPYSVLAVFVIVVAAVFTKLKLPDISGDVDHHITSESGKLMAEKPIMQHFHFIAGVLAQFCYVGAQCAIFAFAINYFIDNKGLSSDKDAALLLSVGMALFTVGRFLGAALLRVIAPPLLLGIYAVVNIVFMGLVIPNVHNLSYVALLGSFFFMSIMFPTIFSISLQNLGDKTKIGASWLVMSIIGGAITPPIMGWIVSVDPKIFKDTTKTATELAELHTRFSSELGWSFIVPLVLFGYIAAYGFLYPRLLNHVKRSAARS